tara:strand:+ start:208 stop:423 length:216 start_codon:yes stop_codon:yes gene_type:complete
MAEERDDECYTLHLTIHDIKLLHYCVKEGIKHWPGAPARPTDEQEHMWYLRDEMFRAMMDHSFYHDPPAER